MSTKSKVLILGDDINTDDIIPANRCTSADPEHLKRYAFEHIIGEENLQGIEVIEAGRNFGCGSSREHAPIAIKAGGIEKVRARSFAEIFYRNSINIGLTLEITEQPQYLSAKDIMLFILGQIGCDGATGKVMEFRGSIIDSLPIDERMTLANMAIECGAICGLMAPDETSREYLNERGSGE